MKKKCLWILTIAALFTCGCETLLDEMDDSRESQELNTKKTSIVYGSDDRANSYEFGDEDFRNLADNSTGILLNKYDINPDPSWEFNPDDVQFWGMSTLGADRELCEDEPFYNDVTLSRCSVTLIDDDLVLTAGHCLDQPVRGSSTMSCDVQRFVFNFRNITGSQLNTITAEDIFSCAEEVVRFNTAHEIDYAIIRLDRPATPRFTPARVKAAEDFLFTDEQPIVVIGSPSGIPTKIAPGTIKDPMPDGDARVFDMNPDTNHGNSGSAVYDATDHSVAGILVLGPEDGDYVWDDAAGCNRNRVCDEVNGCAATNTYRHIRGIYVSEALSIMCTDDPTASYRLCGSYLELGDANGDGSITQEDAMMTLEYATELNPVGFFPGAADVNEDGQITQVDAMLISQYVDGIIISLPPIAGCTCPQGCDSIQTASVPFVMDGAASACYFFENDFGSFTNNWNNLDVNLNGQDIRNTYLSIDQYPSQVDGGYYLFINSDVPWAHTEVR